MPEAVLDGFRNGIRSNVSIGRQSDCERAPIDTVVRPGGHRRQGSIANTSPVDEYILGRQMSVHCAGLVEPALIVPFKSGHLMQVVEDSNCWYVPRGHGWQG